MSRQLNQQISSPGLSAFDASPFSNDRGSTLSFGGDEGDLATLARCELGLGTHQRVTLSQGRMREGRRLLLLNNTHGGSVSQRRVSHEQLNMPSLHAPVSLNEPCFARNRLESPSQINIPRTKRSQEPSSKKLLQLLKWLESIDTWPGTLSL